MPGPIEGLKVVDFSRVLAGPLCARTLQDLGAEVLKIEPPRADVSRFSAPINPNGMSGYYAQQNAGKRNISIDLNLPEAREIALRLCDEADVVVENFRPGALGAFGLDYATLAQRNPKLIYVSISGYGQGGPFKGRMAYAPTVQAEAGFTHHSLRHFGENLQAPQTDALSHADVYAGLQGVIAVLAAVRQRETTKTGQHIDVAMAATVIAINERAHVDLNGLELEDEPAILGATDGSFFTEPGGEQFISAISVVGTISFRFFMAAMRRPDLALDPRFATPGARRANLEALKDVIQAWIYSFADMASLDAQLDEAKIAIGEIRSLEEVAESDWAGYWRATLEVSDRNGGSFRLPGRPWRFSNAELPTPGEPALQGEHNAQVCSELGIAPSAIKELEESGALVGNFAARMIESVHQSVAADLARMTVATDEPEQSGCARHPAP
ncbi:MAG: CoA transferase [Deltaproteobacteria bacterium]|jgi:crotonobetainyl-CoA:carnitine CoA-transferase CaiB-like acyl-CoA transferase|nr:CoA transferase [Deltaproteobacteria bacterium]